MKDTYDNSPVALADHISIIDDRHSFLSMTLVRFSNYSCPVVENDYSGL